MTDELIEPLSLAKHISNGTIPVLIGFGLFIIAGFGPSLITRRSPQRTWLLTIMPMALMASIVLTDGEYLKPPGMEITKLVVWISGIFGVCWYIQNTLDKAMGIKFKKGDIEVEIAGGIGYRGKDRRVGSKKDTGERRRKADANTDLGERQGDSDGVGEEVQSNEQSSERTERATIFTQKV